MDNKALIEDLQQASMEKYGSFSYSSGYLGSMLVALLDKVPAHYLEESQRMLQETIKQLKAGE